MSHVSCHAEAAVGVAMHSCGQTWMRATVGYRRIDGKWKVVHEHVSVPFNPMDNQAWFMRDPNTVDAPDYGQPGEK